MLSIKEKKNPKGLSILGKLPVPERPDQADGAAHLLRHDICFFNMYSISTTSLRCQEVGGNNFLVREGDGYEIDDGVWRSG